MSGAPDKKVIFIENAIPPMRDGVYTLTSTHTVPNQEPGTATANAAFIVQGERFSIRPAEIDSVFPPPLANGEFDGVLPHVLLSRLTLPWERMIDTPGSANDYPKAPWLAVLLCDGPKPPGLVPAKVTDLFPAGKPITGSGISRTGACPDTALSYPPALLRTLGYGESPDDSCQILELPIDLFDAIAPAAADLVYLAHVRETDTADAPDTDSPSVRRSVVVGNRVPPDGPARAYLVSLEGMADFLPDASGTRSASVPGTIETVRLLAYRAWDFTANSMDQSLERLLQGLNAPAPGAARDSVLTLPIAGDPPSAAMLAEAMAAQQAGSLQPPDATVLVQNALLLGFVPMGHHLRHGGHTVSFYRGPLAPVPVASTGAAYYPGPDAANAYNPQTGMFDVSLGAAWQLGQLLALQNAGMANALSEWKRCVTRAEAAAAEQALLAERLSGAALFESVLGRRAAFVDDGPPPLPDAVAAWFARLARLEGVPFNYLVPDERMLPPESLRFFHLDPNWVDALIDGAFSIGRATARVGSLEHRFAPGLRAIARTGGRGLAANRAAAQGDAGGITGFILRSQAVSGWPNLRILGFTDPNGEPLTAIRSAPLSSDTLIYLFPGTLAQVTLREPPEAQHLGMEGVPGNYYTTLRSVVGGPGSVGPGKQYEKNPNKIQSSCDPTGMQPWACLKTRGGGRTLDVAGAAAAIWARLKDDFGQVLENGFTAAEFGLEMTKGVVEVEFRND